MDTNPLLRLVVPLVVGILLGEWCESWLTGWGVIFLMLSFISIVLTFVIYLYSCNHSRKPFPFLVALNVALFALGAGMQLQSIAQLETDWSSSAQNYRALVVETPKSGEKVWQVTAKVLGGMYDGRKVRLALMKRRGKNGEDIIKESISHSWKDATFSDSIMTGDVLLFHARIRSPQNAGNPSEFDFSKWLRHQGFSGSAFCFATQWRKSGIANESLPFQVRVLQWRDQMVQQYERFFEGRDLGILAAMTLGDKTHLDGATRDVFSQTGVSHVLALSGFHLSVLFAIYQSLVLALCRRRWLYVSMSIWGIGGLWIFTFLAGLPLSLVRASVMFSVMQLVGCFRHDSFSINNLSLAAIVLLLASPQSLFDVGFQLSFLSVFSIILFANSIPCPLFFKKHFLLKWGYGLFIVSLCAQLATSPLVAYYFHTFPIYGFLSNLVAVPLAYAILTLSIMFFVLPFARQFIAFVLGALLWGMDESLSILSEMPGAVLELYPTRFTVVLIYLFFFFAISYIVHRRGWKLFAAMVTLFLVSGIELYAHRPHRLSSQIVFYNLRTLPVLHVIVSADESYLWSMKQAKADSLLMSVRRTFWKQENIKSPMWLTEELRKDYIYFDGRLLDYKHCRVAFVFRPLPSGRPEKPLAVDYLLLARGAKDDFEELLRCYHPRKVILDASLTDFYHRKYFDAARNKEIQVHDMREQGALRVVWDERQHRMVEQIAE